jgi:hypothetical protein
METLSTFRNSITPCSSRKAKSSLVVFGLTMVLASCGGAASGGGSTPPPTATLTASPTPIAAGQSAKLTFSSTNATSGTINNSVGTVGINNSAGIPVSPVETTIYTFTATGPGGSATASATVAVVAAPAVTISASPTAVDPLGSTFLTVAASGASQLVVTDNLGDTPYTFPSASGGTQSFAPRVTAVYTATATGVNGSTAANNVTVTVLPPAAPTVTLTANPAAVIVGGNTTLTWTSANATSLVISSSTGSGGGPVTPVAGGSTAVPAISATTTYTATAYGANGTTPATATVTVPVDAITSFEGMNYQVSGGLGQTDIDPNGAVGTKQFMEYVNTSYQAYAKTAPFTPVWSAPQPIGTPWGNDQHCGGPKIQLDAVIIFDRLASRWVIAAKTTVSDDYYFCIAVSSTDDLTSSSFTWYPFGWKITDELGLNAEGVAYLPDWPKLGTGADAYYATMDLTDPSNNEAESGILACAFDRTNMLINGTVNTPQCFGATSPLSDGVYLGHSLIPADVDGTNPPPAGRDEFMVSIENPINDGTTLTSTSFNLWDFHVDWANPSSSTFTQSAIAVPAYTPGCYLTDPLNPTITNCVLEPAAAGFDFGQKVDSVGDRMMPRFAYRNFGTYESFLISQTVQTNLGAGQDAEQTGILWYELRGSGTPTVYQQGLISPDSTYFRFLPSIAQDHVGNAAVGYNISNTFTNPGIDVSYWSLTASTQPTEVTILNAPGEEVTTSTTGVGQWGSYSSMTVDPADDCTFWYVNEYWLPIDSTPADDEWATNIAFFQVPGCQ